MRIGNRLFPYPTLNNDENLSEYKNSSFVLHFDTDENGGMIYQDENIIIKNVHIELSNSELSNLLDRGLVKCSLIVESAVASYREMFIINKEPVDVVLNKNDLADMVFVSAYIWATEDIERFKTSSFKEEYSGLEFEIDKYDILAIDDGFKFRLDVNPEDDNKLPSIFSIVQRDGDDNLVEVYSNKERVVISLTSEYYNKYESIKAMPGINNAMFGLLAVPALTAEINKIKNSSEGISIDEIIEHNRWFKPICASYEKSTGLPLTDEEFADAEPIKIAQAVINFASANGLKDYADFLLHGTDNESGEDDRDE